MTKFFRIENNGPDDTVVVSRIAQEHTLERQFFEAVKLLQIFPEGSKITVSLMED